MSFGPCAAEVPAFRVKLKLLDSGQIGFQI